MLLLTDNRSGVQVGAAEGSASKVDFSAAAVIFGSHGGGGMGGYTNTPQGKVIVAAFTDSYNQLVRAVPNYRPQTMGGQGLGTGGKLAVDGAASRRRRRHRRRRRQAPRARRCRSPTRSASWHRSATSPGRPTVRWAGRP
ncbi:MAG: hypothetical protein V9G12_17665 [Microthrixaceae bacterium]